MKLWNGISTLVAAAAFSVAAFGQGTTTPPATCKTAPTALTALNFERALPLANVLTTLTPNAPANVLAAIAGGAQEIRDIEIYNPQLNTVTSTVFLVAAGAPLPTPNFNFTTGVVQTSTLQVSSFIASCTPSPSILLSGTVIGSSPNGIYGSLTGAPAALSIGYTTDNPPKLNNVAVVVSGVATAWSASASGTLTVTTPSTPTTPPSGTGPTIVVKFANGTVAVPNTTTQTNVSPFFLDATGSTGSGALTFTWSTTSNSPVAFVGTGTPGQILVQLPSLGDYAIQLTVTDASGNKATFSLTLEYTGQPK